MTSKVYTAGDWELGHTCRVIMAAGLALGFGAGAFAAALTSLTPGVFTSDAALHPTMRSLAPQVSPESMRAPVGFFVLHKHGLSQAELVLAALSQVLGSMILCGIDVAGNGLLIAASKYKNLDRVRNSMARTLVLLSLFIWQSTSRGWGLSGIWTGEGHPARPGSNAGSSVLQDQRSGQFLKLELLRCRFVAVLRVTGGSVSTICAALRMQDSVI